jgi:hypothetical protein
MRQGGKFGEPERLHWSAELKIPDFPGRDAALARN